MIAGLLGCMSLLWVSCQLISHLGMRTVSVIGRVFSTGQMLGRRKSLVILLEVLALGHHDHPWRVVLLFLDNLRRPFVLHWLFVTVSSHHHWLVLILTHSQVVSVSRLILIVLGVIDPWSKPPKGFIIGIITYSESWPMLVLSTELLAMRTIPLEVCPF